MKYRMDEIASEIGFCETWIRCHEKEGHIKLEGPKVRGRMPRYLTEKDRTTLIRFAKSILDRKKVEAHWRLFNG